jgi:hypothetical protein
MHGLNATWRRLPLSGTFIALASDGAPASSDSAAAYYKVTLNIGGLQLYCSVMASNLNMLCTGATLDAILLSPPNFIPGMFFPQR